MRNPIFIYFEQGMILISEKNSLRVIKTIFVTKDGKELEKEQLTNEQYQASF